MALILTDGKGTKKQIPRTDDLSRNKRIVNVEMITNVRFSNRRCTAIL